MNEYKVPIRYGVIAALLMAMISFGTYLFYETLFTSLWGIAVQLLVFIILLILMIVGGIAFRKDKGEVLNYREAVVGLVIIFSLGILGATVMNYLVANVIDTDYPENASRVLSSSMESWMEKANRPQSEIDKNLADMTPEKFNPGPVELIKGFGKMLGFGLILSLIIAFFIKRKPKPVVIAEDSIS